MKGLHWILLSIGIALVAAGLLLPVSEPIKPLSLSATARSSLRDTQSGPVVGGLADSGAQVWLGIPYAAPPTGGRRWRAPEAPQAWLAPRAMLHYGPVCPQFASRLSAIDVDPGTLIGEEDCLRLNVFAPAAAAVGTALPVMVFIHGGGNSSGSARPYDASRFVQEQGLLMVTLNYRLGPLGWFSHEALRETADNPRDASGNFALLDILQALRWVRDNIEAFGGDPERVTVFGESAGGRNVFALLVAREARGLFHRAIIQSGTAGSFSLARAEAPADATPPGHRNSATEMLLSWVQQAGIAGDRAAAERSLQRLSAAEILELMRGLSVPELLAPLAEPGGFYSLPALFRDGAVLPASALLDAFTVEDGWNRVPVIIGSNRDEMKLFLAFGERHVSRRFGFIPVPKDPVRYERLARYHSRQWRATGVDEALARMSRTDPELPLFSYRFDWDDMRANAFVDLPALLGAAHSLELDFLFGPLLARVVPGVLHNGNRRGYRELSRAMRDYWAGFAYNGRPSSGRSGTYPLWPGWSAAEPRVMLLDETQDGGLRSDTLAVRIDEVKAELTRDRELPARLRCALYVDLFRANRGLEQLFDANEYRALGCAPFRSVSLEGLSR